MSPSTASFWFGVLASLVAALICFVIVQIKTGVEIRWGTIKLFWSITKRLKNAGVSNIFPTRSSYAMYRKERSISDYVKTTNHELIYVGFWLAEGIEIDTILAAIQQLLQGGRTIELILLDENLSDLFSEKTAEYLALTPQSLRGRLAQAWNDLRRIRNALPDHLKTRFILRKHDEMLTSSAFVFDLNTSSAKTLVDFKLYGAGRARSFGIELKPSTADSSLYLEATNAFLEIKKRSTVAN
jgi:hypothetical protein